MILSIFVSFKLSETAGHNKLSNFCFSSKEGCPKLFPKQTNKAANFLFYFVTSII